MPNLQNGTKGGFEPGLTRLRVRHSTTELHKNMGESHHPIEIERVTFEDLGQRINFEIMCQGTRQFDFQIILI